MPAALQERCTCTDSSRAASCRKVRSHPPLQWRGKTSAGGSHAVADVGWESPCPPKSAGLRQSCWVPHVWKTHHAVPCLHLGVGNLPGGYLPGSPGAVTLSHPWPISTFTPVVWGSALPWAQLWGAKATCAVPQVTNCCLQFFLLSVEMCLQDFWRRTCWCVFIA